jgi:hypothetical protein
VDDEPRFGNEPTFSMPLTTEDLAAALDRQHYEDFEAQVRETERQRQKIERMRAKPDAKKQGRKIFRHCHPHLTGKEPFLMCKSIGNGLLPLL